MLERWRSVGILVFALFALNVAGRWAPKLLKSESQQDIAGLALLVSTGLVFFGMTIYWGRLRPFSRVALDLGLAALAASLLSAFVGPLTIGESPFAKGAGNFFSQFWVWGALTIAGVALAYIGLVAFTADYRSQQLKRFADRAKSLPKRVARG